MLPLNNLGPDLNSKSVNMTQYRGFNLKGYSDSDYVGCNMDRKSTSGACQLLGGKLVCWSAKKQQSVAMSSAEAEYVAIVGCYANILWMKSQLTDYDIIYEKETKSSSAMDTSPSHLLPPTPVVGEIHKEAQQAAGGPTSLKDTSEDGAHPQLNSDKTKSAGDGLKTTHPTLSTNEESGADNISRKVKLEDLADIFKDTRSSFFTPDSPTDEPIIVSDVAELKNIQWEFPTEFLDLPHLASSVQEKFKTLDSLPGLLKMVTNTLNRFSTLVENALGATTMGVPSVDKATASPAKGEKDADTNLKNELVDLLGIDIVTQYYNKKLLYERYCEKMKKRKVPRSSTKVYKARKRLLYAKRNKAISLGKGASKVNREDDIPLVSVYTTGDVRVRGMLIPNEFLTKEICVTDDFKEYDMVFMNVDVPMNQSQLVSERNHHDDDSEDRLELRIQKDNPKHADDEKVEEEVGGEMGSLETRTEETQTTIPTPPRSPRTILSSDKNITQKLTDTVPLLTTTTSQTSNSKRGISTKYSHLPGALRRMCRCQGDDDIHSHHDDHQKDDAPPDGEKIMKRHKALKISKSTRGSSSKNSTKDSTTYVSKQQQQQQEWDAWVEEPVIDEDEVIPKDKTPKLITELQNVDKRVPTIYDYERMRATLNDALSNQFKNAEENCIIWKRVHDFQLGIESYQFKVNFTAPTLTFPSIEACEPYTIVEKPYTGLIYLNGKGKKRKNRTLLDMVGSMKNLTTLSLSFWDYALESATRILNMVPTKKVDKTPYELWYGKVPNLSYLKVYRCEVEGFEPPQEEVILIRRSKRTHRAPISLCLNVEVEEHSLWDLNEPTSYKATMLDLKFNKWLDAMNAKMQSMIDNMVWVLVDLPPNSKGYTQLYEVDYEETFSPVADIRAIRILISIAAFYDYEIWQMDVKTAFLYGYLDEDIYMASESNVTFLILYVDDIIIMRNHIPSLQSVKDYPGKCFAMKDFGEAIFILEIKIYRDRSQRLIGISQSAYIYKILKRYKMDNSKHGHIPMQERLNLNKTQGALTHEEVKRMQNIPYASAVGSIMYAVRCTRPDVAFAQNITSHFQQNPAELRVDCYCDAGSETDRDDIKSQT
uniref:Reverse transcriptase Ty1/copia-type domain-containing protein n=1 Tax=Tanacetum cinerariifolium TaxID=118510 RepID=A0A699H3P2_TANCI|nr:hypothetical protein [Tanacetum cinerariifolium]